MIQTEYTIYWTTENGPQSFDTCDMKTAMKFIEEKRKQVKNGLNITHIVMSAENPNQVGEMGVASIENGKCPNGTTYDWVKRRDPDNKGI